MIGFRHYFLRYYKVFLISIITLSMCVACFGISSVPEDHYYLLPKKKSNINKLEQPLVNSVAVAQVIAEGLYRERSILFIDAVAPLELKQYHYRHWAKAPSYLLQEDLVDLFRQANYANDVLRYDPKNTVDVVIKGRLLRFEQIISTVNSEVNVAIEFEVRHNRGEQNKKWRKVYEIREQAEGKSIHKIVEAFGRALTKIYAVFLGDLKKS